MADEINSDIHHHDDDDTHSSSDQHNQEIHQRRLSTKDETDSNTELFQNGDHQEDSSIQSNGNHSIEELISSSPFHIQSIHSFDDQILQQSTNEQDSFQINTNYSDQSNILDQQDHSNLSLVDNETSNLDDSFHLETNNHHDKPDELKAQRDLDDDDIPPAELSTDETTTTTTTNEEIPINHETPHSSSENESNITDDRPLTDLETPYEHHHHQDENEVSPVELDVDENSNNNEHSSETSSLSLPDVVTETFEQNHEEYIPQPIQLEQPTFEEISVKTENNHIDEILPPLPPSSIALEETNDLNKIEEQQLLTTIESPSEDILGNRTLFKQTIVPGIPATRPTRSTLATVSYTLSLIDTVTSDVREIERISNESFFISEFDTIPAIDISIQSMNRGERASIDSDIRHCYGEIGCEEKQIPSINSNISPYRMKIDLEFHDWISPPDVQTLSIDQRLFWGDKKRQMGNFYYRRKNYPTSLQCYHGALRFLDTENNPILITSDENQRSILNDHYIQVQNNVAQVNLFLNKYQACLNAVENVLKHDPKNVKALFRQGKALFELGKYEQAIQPLKTFRQIQRANSAAGNDFDKANEMITTSENKVADYQKNEKEIYRRMFQPPPPPPTTTTTANQQRQTKTNKQTDNNNNHLWLYFGLGSAALAAIGLFAFMKYRKTS